MGGLFENYVTIEVNSRKVRIGFWNSECALIKIVLQSKSDSDNISIFKILMNLLF